MRKEVVENVATLFEGARYTLKKDGYLTPAYIVVGSEGERGVVLVDGNLMDLKPYIDELVEGAGNRIIGLILITETWFVAAPSLGEDEPRPSEHPDRQEALMMQLFDNRGNMETWMQPFGRDEDDNIVYEEDYKITSEMTFARLDPWGDKRKDKPEA